MERMKTFGIYALCIILFFIFSNVMIDIAIKSTYNEIEADIVLKDNLKLDINTAKVTYVNGYVKGSITNTGETPVEKTYVKIDLYSKRDVLLGTKYVEIKDLQKGEKKDFDMGFRFSDVKYTKISMVDKVEENATDDSFTSDKMSGIALITAVIFLCYFG